MYPFITAIMWLLLTVLDIYLWVIIAAVVASWLITFEVINVRHPFVRKVLDVLNRVTEPVMERIRRFIPSIGGLDFSPLIVILVIIFLQRLIISYWPGVEY